MLQIRLKEEFEEGESAGFADREGDRNSTASFFYFILIRRVLRFMVVHSSGNRFSLIEVDRYADWVRS